ncbi:MAG: hypothetical protein P4L86_22655 [Mycobacterium sp.]|nr:hypothetical protein [Mycobacterium sp.]
MQTTTNTLLCEAAITPDGSVMVIEDIGASGISGTYVHADLDCGMGTVQNALWVHTMNVHECVVVGRPVSVRVFSGADTHGLGVPAFCGELNVASGVLAVGDRHNPGRQLLLGSPSVVRVSVFLGNDIEVVGFDNSGVGYPVSGPSEVNVLLHGDPGFAPAVADPKARWARRPWPRPCRA